MGGREGERKGREGGRERGRKGREGGRGERDTIAVWSAMCIRVHTDQVWWSVAHCMTDCSSDIESRELCHQSIS